MGGQEVTHSLPMPRNSSQDLGTLCHPTQEDRETHGTPVTAESRANTSHGTEH